MPKLLLHVLTLQVIHKEETRRDRQCDNTHPHTHTHRVWTRCPGFQILLPLVDCWIIEVHISWSYDSSYDIADCWVFMSICEQPKCFGVGGIEILGILSGFEKWTYDACNGPPSATGASTLGLPIGLSNDWNKSSICEWSDARNSDPSSWAFLFDSAFNPWIRRSTPSNSTRFETVKIRLCWFAVAGISLGRKINRNMGCYGGDEQNGFSQIPWHTWFWYPSFGGFGFTWQATAWGLAAWATSVQFAEKGRADSMVQRSPDSDPSYWIPLSTCCCFIIKSLSDRNEHGTDSSSLGVANGLPDHAEKQQQRTPSRELWSTEPFSQTHIGRNEWNFWLRRRCGDAYVGCTSSPRWYNSTKQTR